MTLRAADVLGSIMAADSLNELQAYVQSKPKSSVRKCLFNLFDERAEYRNARDWAEVVRICEALTIVGWGVRERVDAICEREENQWHTYFVSEKGDYRFLYGGWTKRKAGFQLWNPEYYASRDRPDKAPVDWMTYGRLHANEFVIVPWDSLPSQRNKRKLSPFCLGALEDRSRPSRVVCQLRLDLQRRLSAEIPPDKYGSGLEKFCFRFVSWWPKGKLKAELRLGRYFAKRQDYDGCELCFDKAFHRRSQEEQIDFIATHLLAAMDHLATQLQSKAVDYDIGTLRADTEQVLARWKSAKTEASSSADEE